MTGVGNLRRTTLRVEKLWAGQHKAALRILAPAIFIFLSCTAPAHQPSWYDYTTTEHPIHRCFERQDDSVNFTTWVRLKSPNLSKVPYVRVRVVAAITNPQSDRCVMSLDMNLAVCSRCKAGYALTQVRFWKRTPSKKLLAANSSDTVSVNFTYP